MAVVRASSPLVVQLLTLRVASVQPGQRGFHRTGLLTGGAFRVLLELPYPAIRAVSVAADQIDAAHGVRLSPAAEVALADHVAQAIARLEEGLPIYNSMLWETKMTYPSEFAIALEVLDVVHRELGRRLPLHEAGFVTLHLVGTGAVSEPAQGMALAQALREVVELVRSMIRARDLQLMTDARVIAALADACVELVTYSTATVGGVPLREVTWG